MREKGKEGMGEEGPVTFVSLGYQPFVMLEMPHRVQPCYTGLHDVCNTESKTSSPEPDTKGTAHCR